MNCDAFIPYKLVLLEPIYDIAQPIQSSKQAKQASNQANLQIGLG
jgi:hypothetical protein